MNNKTAEFLAGAFMVVISIIILGTVLGVVWRWLWRPLFLGLI